MSIEIKRSDKYVDYNISAANNRGYITIDTSDWINKPWMFYELPALKFEIYTETDGELVKYQNFTREIRTYNPVYSPLGVLNVTIDIRNVPEEFILRITPIFDNDAIAARNMLIENGIENGEIWWSDQDVPTQLFNLDLEFIECEGEYIPPTPPVPPTHEETITGVPPITFSGSTGEPLVSWTILGNGSQSGTPTPDNPVMPEFVGVRTGNLLDSSVYELVPVSASAQKKGTNLGVLPQGTYTFNAVSATSATPIYRTIKNGSTFTFEIIKSLPYTFTADGVSEQIIRTSGTQGSTWAYSGYSSIMLNTGSTALPYEPYGWAEKITCAGQTIPVYLGQTQTVRRIKKLVLTGEENIESKSGNARWYIPIADMKIPASVVAIEWYCSHYQAVANNATWTSYDYMISWSSADTGSSVGLRIRDIDFLTGVTLADFKSYLAAQYAAGTPVTIWYVLANEQTGIVNEPLCKIGDYADELHSEDTGVAIPTANGNNVLTVDTPIQPSEMTITYTKEGQ